MSWVLSVLAGPRDVGERDSPWSKGAHGPAQVTTEFSVVASDWSLFLGSDGSHRSPFPSSLVAMCDGWWDGTSVPAGVGLWGHGMPG